jgi:uncharacterized iron-regulated membrane protein
MKPGFRMAMTWLHDWSGLVVGWLLFVIALAGTLSVFRDEIGDWARPEARCCAADSAAAGAAAARWLTVHAPGARAWYIRPADARSTTSYVAWSDKNGTFVQKWLDAGTGSPAGIRETLGGDFFYRLHFELQLPYPWGRVLSASAALAMLLALLTGIIAHRRFFADFFTFRPRKGQRSWLDAHNLLAVTALPFHLLIAFTGALTLAQLIMPWGASAAYHGDAAAFAHALDPAAVGRPAAGRAVPMAPIEPVLREAQRRFAGGLFEVNVLNPGDAAAVVTVTRAEDARIGVQSQSASFDGATGHLIAAHDESRPAVATYKVLYALHTARFAQATVRWLYFLSGLALAALIGTGLLLWTAKRRQTRRDVGFALVERLNLGFVGGTPIAFAAFFLANRLVPLDWPQRADIEVHAVFWTWAGVLAFAALRSCDKAWPGLLKPAAVAFLAIALADGLNGAGAWTATRLAIDLIALVFASLSAIAASIVGRARSPSPARAGRKRAGH